MILRCPYIQVVWIVYFHFLSTGQKLRSVHNLFVAAIVRTGDGVLCPLAATLVLDVHGKDTSDSEAEYVVVYCKKAVLQEKSAECWSV
jgi:hypothetical protein